MNETLLHERDRGIDDAWATRWERGRRLMGVYILVAILAVAAGAAVGFGPFALIALAQEKLLGAASPILSAIIGYATVGGPVFVLMRRKSDAGTPLLMGAQHAIDPKRKVRFVAAPARQIRWARSAVRNSLAMVGLALLAGRRVGTSRSVPLPTLASPCPP